MIKIKNFLLVEQYKFFYDFLMMCIQQKINEHQFGNFSKTIIKKKF